MRTRNFFMVNRITMENDITIKWGPLGRPSASSVNWDDGVHQKIEKIVIGHSDQDGIKFIQAVYSDSDNNHSIELLGPQHGSNEGYEATTFKLINISKPVTRIKGTYHTLYGIKYLEFSNSEGTYGSIGIKSGNHFTFESDLGYSAFHGITDCKSLRSLGVYINTSVKKHLMIPSLLPTNISY